MAGMQLVKSSVVPKSSVNITSVVREASCSRGWLRIVVQYIFGAITVTSFILIVLMSMSSPPKNDNSRTSSCYEQNCKVRCNDTTMPYYEDVYSVVSEAELHCSKLFLGFVNPIFVNETLPSQWLSRLRSITSLGIKGGNLRYIESQAFMSLFAGKIETLVFEGVSIHNLMPNTLVGLSSLRQLYFKNCNFINIRRDALRAVDDTLGVLTINRCGYWDPRNISGVSVMTSLETVDFSYNTFDNMLTNESFTGLQHCKILYLNSCNITALGAGTFDYLHRIEVIYLNNNLLVTIPSGLFNGMIERINPRPRINLQDNPWYCDCETQDLISLHYYGLLYLDPTCDTPEELHGETFSAISNHCSNYSHEEVNVVDIVELKKDTRSSVMSGFTGACEVINNTWSLITPNEMYSCDMNMTLVSLRSLVATSSSTFYNDISRSDWITPKYLMRSNNYTIVQIIPLTTEDYGIMWFKTGCANEIYCMSTMPSFLRVYDIYLNDQYTFCPINLEHEYVMVEKCVIYSIITFESDPIVRAFGSVVLYICTAFICLAFGAAFVYGIIRYNPVLLKGSKRLLFVKHKNVEALVLPPKVPLRSALSTLDPDPNFNVTKLHVPDKENNLSPRAFVRMKSNRSDKSTVSYISALQPTEDQLAEWRVKRHFDNNFAIANDAEMSIISWINDGSSTPEYISNITYESLK